MLYIIATPIGNLKDITLRALEVLESVDGIICEDTRRTSILLNHYKIKKPLYTLNDFNESKEFPKYLNLLIEGKNLALVSDAGTPLIADPGFKLLQACFEANIPVDSLPGPNAAISALTLSGLATNRTLFLGYLPEKPGKRQNYLKKNLDSEKNLGATFIIYVAPHKLIKTLEDFNTLVPNINITLACELTKMHQRIDSKRSSIWLSDFTNKPPKGEYVLLFHLKGKD